MNLRYFLLALSLAAVEVSADNSTLDAAIGNEFGGRDGAIIGEA